MALLLLLKLKTPHPVSFSADYFVSTNQTKIASTFGQDKKREAPFTLQTQITKSR